MQRQLTDRRRAYLRIRIARKRQEIKKRAVEYLGGKCSSCGYNKSVAALDFHHKDPSVKDFRISDGQPRAWEKVKLELDKCILLCKNCHAELHHAETSKQLDAKEAAWHSKELT